MLKIYLLSLTVIIDKFFNSKPLEGTEISDHML